MGDVTLCWIDLETTGLDARYDIPIELAIKLTDDSGLKVEYANSWLIHDDTPEYKEKITFATRHQFVGPMHDKSGLWQDLMDRELYGYMSRNDLDNKLCDIFDELEIKAGTVPLIGNSIGSLDRPFVLEHFPRFNLMLSYRNLDMSTLKELCKRHNPGLYENLKPIIGTKEDAPHRSMGDIDACVTEYRAYLDNFLICGDED